MGSGFKGNQDGVVGDKIRGGENQLFSSRINGSEKKIVNAFLFKTWAGGSEIRPQPIRQ